MHYDFSNKYNMLLRQVREMGLTIIDKAHETFMVSRRNYLKLLTNVNAQLMKVLY